MKYLLPLLFLPLFAQAQTITFHEGAGLNPRHIESLGPDSGWVEVWVGPMATSGCVFDIKLESPSEMISWQSFTECYTAPTPGNFYCYGSEFGIKLHSINKCKHGTMIRVEYKVKYTRP